MKQPQQQSSFDVDRFISGAKTATTADRPPAKARRAKKSRPRAVSKAKPAAPGFTRASFDLPDDLHERLKIAAVREHRPMRELVEEAIATSLDTLGY